MQEIKRGKGRYNGGGKEEKKMDETLKNIISSLGGREIGIDETFKFHCTCCGKCCTHREDILLNPSVRVKPKGHVKRCPLLKDRKCIVHKSKPSVCALFPIGRFLQVGDAEGNIKDISVEDVQYIFSSPGCGDNAESHTVREWLRHCGIPIEDEFFIKWQKVIMETSIIFRKMEKKFRPQVMELAWTAAFVVLYLHYDTGEGFLPQFEENAQSFQELLHKIQKD